MEKADRYSSRNSDLQDLPFPLSLAHRISMLFPNHRVLPFVPLILTRLVLFIL